MSEVLPKVNKIHITDSGRTLFETIDLHKVIDVMKQDAARPAGQGPFVHIGSGKSARVSQFPDRPDLCLKMESWFTNRHRQQANRTRKPGENLIKQTIFMDRLQCRLVHTEAQSGICSPRHFLAILFSNNVYVGLQERIPEAYESFVTLIKGTRVEPTNAEVLDVFKERLNLALGFSPLRLGLDDISGGRQVSSNNVLFKTDGQVLSDPYSTEIALIDQPNARFRLAQIALGLDKITHSLTSDS